MGGVARENHVAVTHGLGDEAAEAEQRRLGDRALREGEPVWPFDPCLQLRPDPIVGPGVDVLLGIALEVHPLQRLTPLADEGEAALRVVVDQFGGTEGCFGQDAEPGKRVLPEVVPALDLRDLEPADTARSVGSDDDFASHFLLDPVGIGEEDARPLAGHVDDSRITDPEPDVAPVPISSRG